MPAQFSIKALLPRREMENDQAILPFLGKVHAGSPNPLYIAQIG
tara:strand:+ start:467 stop:598 length:132 start_codon:yes stop_codon:yes gene_type:complete